ncbi:ribosomal protein S18-alanine N-acetyltransferase [Lapidilactobacillus gannanensis]|uniref:Ribosomal protein S18-alanine N-acetyltransferase n=1 Tax=Lapidilactobacillus gannanensis TaxID=2486002 RepID=A0ABW4BNL6_9LACO|nr:ribosomal protein S18-alanine N-acetyltransferase [Lapidilactobacillus gannanensis]MCH4056524.1 ribosomal protein S18-alanine N-acetyltransferase [Lactobacillaceae bacterium]
MKYPYLFTLAGHDYYLRPLVAGDLDQVLVVERELYAGMLPWSRWVFLNEINHQSQRLYWGLFTPDDQLIGYIGCWLKFRESHITNLAIAKDWQGRGLGRFLMKKMIVVAQAHQCQIVTLEARTDNLPALNLYHQLGFIDQKVRVNYYDYDHSDAVSMCLSLNKK